MYKQALEVYSN